MLYIAQIIWHIDFNSGSLSENFWIPHQLSYEQHYVIDGFKHFFTAKKIPSLFLKLNMIAILGTFSVVTLVNPSNTQVFRVLPENLKQPTGYLDYVFIAKAYPSIYSEHAHCQKVSVNEPCT